MKDSSRARAEPAGSSPPRPSAARGPKGRWDGLAALARGAFAQWRLGWSLVRLKPFDTGTDLGRSNERYRRIALTTISSVAVRGLGTLIGLVTVPLVLAHLGKEQFGLWSTITTVVAWVAVFDFGIANGLVNCVSRAHGQGNEEDASRHVSTALAMLLGIAGVLAVIVAIAGATVPWSSLLAVRGAVDERTVTWSVVAALGVFVVGMPLSVVPQIYAGYQKTYVANAFHLVALVAGFAALLVALRVGAGMPALVVVFGIGSVLATTLGLVYAFATMPWVRLRLSAISRDAARSLMSRSAPLFLFQIGALAVNETQAIILAHRCDLGTVAEYSIVMRLYVLAVGLIQVSTSSFVPAFREARERGDAAWMQGAFRHFVRMRVALAAAAGIFMVVAGDALLRLWLRRSDIAFGPAVWSVLAVMIVAVTWVAAHSELMSIMDRIWVLVGLVLLNGIVTVPLTYWLAPKLQVLGVVVATAALTVSFYTWLVPALTRKLVFSAP